MFHPHGPTFWELAQQALSSTQRGYDLLAPKFDYTPFRTPDWMLDAVAPYLEGNAQSDTALDLCCGTGAGIRILRPQARRVVGVDFSQGMLDQAQRQTSLFSGSAKLHFVRGNVLSLPFAGGFQQAVCFGALGHILPRDEEAFVEQIARALDPGGRFVTVTSTMPPIWSRRYLLSRSFNAAMHVRNWLVRPPFVMFYLTFLLPGVATLFEQHGFDVQVKDEPALRYPGLKVLVAVRRA